MGQDTASRHRLDPRNLFYGWYIVLAGSASNFLIFGLVFYGFGVFIKPIRDELGWSVTAISWGVSIRSFEQGLLSPVSGYLLDRLGPRKMGVAGVTVLAAGLLIFSYAHDLWVYYVASVTMALGQSLGPFTPFSLAIVNWFQKKRGRAMGVFFVGSGLGFLAVGALAALVGALGWRETIRAIAITVLVAGVPLALVLRRYPEPYGYLPDGGRRREGGEALSREAAGAGPAAPSSGLSVADALRTPAFYLLALATAAGGAVQGWVVHQVPHLRDVGFSPEAVGLIVGAYGITQVVLRIGTGWLGDVIGRHRLFIACYALMGMGMWLFANLAPSRLWLLPLYYLTFAPGHAGWSVLGQTMVADYFGTRRYATLRGLASVIQVPVGALAPVVAGWQFDRSDSYRLIFALYAAVLASGVLWLLLIRRPVWGATPAARQVGTS